MSYIPGTDPYGDINWEFKDLIQKDKFDNIIFQKTCEFPDYFPDNHASIVASKYFMLTPRFEENSLKQLFDRVSNTIGKWGAKDGYFSEEESDEFINKLKYYQSHQYFAFNSPVYFNCGIHEKPQLSACFILSIEDSMESISNIFQIESRIFKRGSGSGMNLSTLRSKFEHIRNETGYASGAVSFLKAHDIMAGAVKSGGSLRRSAKMAILNVDHPDIEEFINCKRFEEEKLKILRDAENKKLIFPRSGYELADEVFFQNTNLSVRVTDQFMDAVLKNQNFSTKYVTKPDVVHKTYSARDILRMISERAWECGDPAILFHDTTNRYNTCANSGIIDASNPCGEFVFLNNSACNLASINLLKFFYKDEYGVINFDYKTFNDVIDIIVTAQDIIIDNSSYPTEDIEKNSQNFRPLGLGFTNLGSTLMYLGHAYDSEEGRNVASHLTSLMTATAILVSNKLAKIKGPFKWFNHNKQSYYNVLKLMMNNQKDLKDNSLFKNNKWNKIEELIKDESEFRNAQLTLIAPTGTISSLMLASTTGIEPEFMHYKTKRLSNTGGSTLRLSSLILKQSLENLNYNDEKINKILNYIEDGNEISSCKLLKEEHRPIYCTANSEYNNDVIDYKGHLRMVHAVQKFINGSISKTINMKNDSTVDEIMQIFIGAWKLGLKGVTIYRDGSKSYQPLTSGKERREEDFDFEIDDSLDDSDDMSEIKKFYSSMAYRSMPDEAKAINHRFKISGTQGYLNCGMYDNGELGEIFITIAKSGSTLSGMYDSFARLLSISLQYGVPLNVLIEKMIGQTFEPNGFVNHPDFKRVNSIVDYIFKYLAFKYLTPEERFSIGLYSIREKSTDEHEDVKIVAPEKKYDGQTCSCGYIMTRKGSCFVCMNCGLNTGSCG